MGSLARIRKQQCTLLCTSWSIAGEHVDIPSGESPERTRLWQMVPSMSQAIARFRDAMYEERTLELNVIEAARMRLAQINDCDI